MDGLEVTVDVVVPGHHDQPASLVAHPRTSLLVVVTALLAVELLAVVLRSEQLLGTTDVQAVRDSPWGGDLHLTLRARQSESYQRSRRMLSSED